MKSTILLILLLFLPFLAISQTIEVQGALKVTTMDTMNTEDKLVVIGTDGTLAIREASTLSIDDQIIEFFFKQPNGLATLINSGLNVLGKNYHGGIIASYDLEEGYVKIVSPEDISASSQWGCYANIIGQTTDEVGTGQFNTQFITNSCGEASIAAELCANLSLNGYDDWFLPSIDELVVMYQNIGQGASSPNTNIGGFIDNWYWSSTEVAAGDAKIINFTDGTYSITQKFNALHVRAMRTEYLDRNRNLQEIINSGQTLTDVLSVEPSAQLIGVNYEGGILFFISDIKGESGLVASSSDLVEPTSPSNNGKYQWGCFGATTGATGIIVGTGSVNTTTIVNSCGENLIAASVCDAFVSNSYDDWFLPSFDELVLMYDNIGQGAPSPNTNVGGFVDDYYWSSTEVNLFQVRASFFTSGTHTGLFSKFSEYRVRAIRDF